MKFNYQTSPPTAETTFSVFVRGNDRSATIPGEISQPVNMTVKLRKESGRWLVYGEPEAPCARAMIPLSFWEKGKG